MKTTTIDYPEILVQFLLIYDKVKVAPQALVEYVNSHPGQALKYIGIHSGVYIVSFGACKS